MDFKETNSLNSVVLTSYRDTILLKETWTSRPDEAAYTIVEGLMDAE
jgi:hypothetical protein